ncbi:MAG TPA: hypothetical protein VK806_11775 [Bacteroidia bacterium]|nr:hypothetical protein [Bacteroidia bacterium]
MKSLVIITSFLCASCFVGFSQVIKESPIKQELSDANGQKEGYEISIDYKIFNNKSTWKKDPTDRSSLEVTFETHFDNDTVRVFINGKLKTIEKCKTLAQLDVATSYIYHGIDTIRTLGVQINKGPIANVEITPKRCCAYVNYWTNSQGRLLLISFLSTLRSYE